MREVVKGHRGVGEDVEVQFRMKRLPAPNIAWNDEMKARITEFKGSNQGLVSQLVAAREGAQSTPGMNYDTHRPRKLTSPKNWNGGRFFFFPLAVAVRAETGQRWTDHREVDFLICHNGALGNS